jgi:hypothetical protein
MLGNSLVALQLAASQEGLSSMELVTFIYHISHLFCIKIISSLFILLDPVIINAHLASLSDNSLS